MFINVIKENQLLKKRTNFQKKFVLKKYLQKKVLIEKKEKENIIVGGGDGSGRSSVLFDFLNDLLNEKQINSFIFLNFEGSSVFLENINSLLTHHGKEKDCFLFHSLTPKTHDELMKFDFLKEETQRNLKDKNIGFLMPYLPATTVDIYEENLNKIFSFLENLPFNKNKEIPIVVDNLSCFNEKYFFRYSEIMKKLNNKGYFFINSTYGMFNINSFDRVFPVLMKDHKHFFIFYSQLNLNNKFINNYNFSNAIKSLDPGSFHYLKDFKLQQTYLRTFFCWNEVPSCSDININFNQKELLNFIQNT